MPRYKVKKPGFFQGRLYGPNGKRSTIVTDKPLDPVPSWVEIIKAGTTTQRKTRATKKKTTTEKSTQEQVEELSFIGEGEKASKVEVL